MFCKKEVRLAAFNYSRDSSAYAPFSPSSSTVLVTGASLLSAANTLIPPDTTVTVMRVPEPFRSTATGEPVMWVGNDLIRAELFAFFESNPQATYSRFHTQQSISGQVPISEDVFRSFRSELNAAVTNEMLRQCKDAQENASVAYKDRGIEAAAAASGDGRYGSRNMRSEHMTAFVLSTYNDCMLAFGHMSLRAKVARGLTSPWAGTAKSAEAHLLRVLLISLVLANFTLKYFVKDADAGATALISASLPDVMLIDCFLHYIKNLYKRLVAAFKKREASKTTGKASDTCDCKGPRNHPPGCGCAFETHASHIYNLVFICAIIADKQAERFATLLSVLKRHLQGDHSECSNNGLHAKMVCGEKHDPVCPRRYCTCELPVTDDGAVLPKVLCGTQVKGGKLPALCYGVPAEAICPDGCNAVPYSSKSVLPITCPYHWGVIEKELDKIIEDAPYLMVGVLQLGTVHTGKAENANSTIAQHCVKGVNQGDESYAVKSTMGGLHANQLAYTRMSTSNGKGLDDCIWQFKVANVLGIGLTETSREEHRQRLRKRLKASDYHKTQAGRLHIIRREQTSKRVNQARTKHSGGVVYQAAATIPIPEVVYRTLRLTVCALFFDCELAGFGKHSDTLMEISIVPVLIRRAADYNTRERVIASLESEDEDCDVLDDAIAPGYEFVRQAGFSQRSQVHAFAQRDGKEVPGHAHLSLDAMKREQTEATLAENMVSFLQDLREELNEDHGSVSIVLVAHNGNTFDGDILHSCLRRHGVDSRELFRQLDIRGMVDTLPVSKKLNWAEFKPTKACTRSRMETFDLPAMDRDLPFAYQDALQFINVVGAPSKQEVAAEQLERESETLPDTESTPAAPEAAHEAVIDDDAAGDVDASDEGIGTIVKGRPTEIVKSKKNVSHALSDVYARVFGHTFSAHIASEDVTALIEIVQHPLFWNAMVNQEVLSSWKNMADHYEALHTQHEVDVLGWTLQHCPSCEHGSRVPHLAEKSDTTEAAKSTEAASELAASIEARWQINLSCRMRVCDTIKGHGIRPGYAPHKQPSLPGATKKTAKKEVIVPEGACACQAMCATTACPCKAASRPCDPAHCVKHDKTTCKCKNK